MKGLRKFENYLKDWIDFSGQVDLLDKFLDFKREALQQERERKEKLRDEFDKFKIMALEEFKELSEVIPMPISEIADRYSIALLKAQRTDADMEEELATYKKVLSKHNGNIWEFVDHLYEINGEIWNLEASLRSGKEEKLGFEEIGRRAIEIRNWNRKRVSIKNQIVEITGEGFADIKINHVSEEK